MKKVILAGAFGLIFLTFIGAPAFGVAATVAAGTTLGLGLMVIAISSFLVSDKTVEKISKESEVSSLATTLVSAATTIGLLVGVAAAMVALGAAGWMGWAVAATATAAGLLHYGVKKINRSIATARANRELAQPTKRDTSNDVDVDDMEIVHVSTSPLHEMKA